MVQGYLTLQEAAKQVSMSVDELKQMAQKGQIRSFQDRGTLRFRIQDIQELGRSRGAGSIPELPLGDAPPSRSKPTSAAKKAPKSPPKQEAPPDVFAFDFDTDNVGLGADLPTAAGAAKGKSSTKTKTPPAGSDSDVRLVADGSDVTFSIPKSGEPKLADSDVKIAPDPLKPKTGVHPPSSSTKRHSQMALGSGAQPKSKIGGSAAKANSPRPNTPHTPADSGVRLVPMDSDSDVKLLGSSDDVALGEGPDMGTTDSNVRLDKVTLPPADSAEGPMNLTEEINLDEEILKQQELHKNEPGTKLKAKSELKLPTTSPFELSESDMEMPAALKPGPKTPKTPKTPKKGKAGPADSSDFTLAASEQTQDGSSDFDLVPGSDGSILLEASDDSSSDYSLDASDEQVLDREATTELTSATSGISLNNPVDQGISLENSADDSSSDFDLSLDVEDTPKPAKSSPADSSEFELSTQKTPKPKKKPGEDSSESEFELSLDSDEAPLTDHPSDSEFELNLESSDEGALGGESDSEFELTLDDSGNLAAMQDEAPQVKSKPKAKKPAAAEEQDIFDTDFEVPALEESDEATVADSELESSDFDLALDDSELAQEDESGSQVVALDEEDSQTIVDEDGNAAVVDDVEVEEESSDFGDLDQDVEVEDDADVEADVEGEPAKGGKTKTVIKERLVQPASWGVMPVIFMLPCVVLMFLVGILGFELVQTTANMKPPGPLTSAVAEMFGQKVTLK